MRIKLKISVLGKQKEAIFTYFPSLPERNLLLLKENSLSVPSDGHLSQRVQPQAAEIEGI